MPRPTFLQAISRVRKIAAPPSGGADPGLAAAHLAEDRTAVLKLLARHLEQITDDRELTVAEAGDGLQLGIVDPSGGEDELADMDSHDLPEHDVQRKTRFGRWQMHRLDVTAFQPDRGFRDSRRLHATRRFLREARELEFALAALELPARQIHGIAQLEGRNVDDEFLRLLDVQQRVTQTAVNIAAVGTEHDGRRRIS